MDLYNKLWEQFLTTCTNGAQARHVHEAWKNMDPPVDPVHQTWEQWNNRDRSTIVPVSAAQMGRVLDTVGLLNHPNWCQTAQIWLKIFDVSCSKLRTPMGCDIWLHTTAHTHRVFRHVSLNDIVKGLQNVCEFQYVCDKDGDGLGAYLTLYTYQNMSCLIEVLHNHDPFPLFAGKYSMSESSNVHRNHNREQLRPLYEKYCILKEIKNFDGASVRRKI